MKQFPRIQRGKPEGGGRPNAWFSWIQAGLCWAVKGTPHNAGEKIQIICKERVGCLSTKRNNRRVNKHDHHLQYDFWQFRVSAAPGSEVCVVCGPHARDTLFETSGQEDRSVLKPDSVQACAKRRRWILWMLFFTWERDWRERERESSTKESSARDAAIVLMTFFEFSGRCDRFFIFFFFACAGEKYRRAKCACATHRFSCNKSLGCKEGEGSRCLWAYAKRHCRDGLVIKRNMEMEILQKEETV